MPRDRRSASVSASASSRYGHIRQPPNAGPSTVECTATIARSPAVDVAGEQHLLVIVEIGVAEHGRFSRQQHVRANVAASSQELLARTAREAAGERGPMQAAAAGVQRGSTVRADPATDRRSR